MLTLIIVTKNRFEFLKKTLFYYNKEKFPYKIVIADSSDKESFDKTTDLVNLYSLNIDHKLYPAEIDLHASYARALEEVDTPYVVWSGDDDFLIPFALTQCVKFLECHQDYNTASGLTLSPYISVESINSQAPRCGIESITAANNRIEIKRVIFTHSKNIVDSSANRRLGDYFYPSWAPNTFSVQQTDNLRATMRRIIDLGLDKNREISVFAEIAIDGLNVIKGKSVAFPGLYLVMQRHSQRDYCTKPISYFDVITFSDFPAVARKITDLWAEEICARDSINFSEAQRLSRNAFLYYIHQKTRTLPQRGEKENKKTGLEERLKQIKWVQMLWTYLKPGRVSYEAFFYKRSKYHNDFMPIYHIITGGID